MTGQSPEQRRLLAILIADVVGYSRMMAADEGGTYAMLRAMQQNLVLPSVQRSRGRIVKWTGDGFIATFDSSVDAVRAAVEIQAGAGAANGRVAENRRLTLRIGINVGDVIITGDDIYGDAVNIAARLQTLAPAGGIAASQMVRDTVRGKFSVEFDDQGDFRVKNIPDPVRTFTIRFHPPAWTPQDARPAAPAAARSAPMLAAERPIAVPPVTENPPRKRRKGWIPIALVIVATVFGIRALLKDRPEKAAPEKPVAQVQSPTQGQQQAIRPVSPPVSPGLRTQAPEAPQPAGPVPGLPQPETPEQAKQKFRTAFLARLASATPRLTADARETVLADYEATGDHKAQVVALTTGRYWRAGQRPSPETAGEQALEGCEVFNGSPCALIAVNDAVEPEPPGRNWAPRLAPRVGYSGMVDAERIPTGDFRDNEIVQKYLAYQGFKAIALHPTGWIFAKVSQTGQSQAEQEALKACNDDRQAKGAAGPCYLYASGDYVVLMQRRTSATATPGPEETAFEGHWTGAFEDGAALGLAIAGGKVVNVTIDGKPLMITRSAISGRNGSFADFRYSAMIGLDGDFLTVEFNDPDRKGRATLRRQ